MKKSSRSSQIRLMILLLSGESPWKSKLLFERHASMYLFRYRRSLKPIRMKKYKGVECGSAMNVIEPIRLSNGAENKTDSR